MIRGIAIEDVVVAIVFKNKEHIEINDLISSLMRRFEADEGYVKEAINRAEQIGAVEIKNGRIRVSDDD